MIVERHTIWIIRLLVTCCVVCLPSSHALMYPVWWSGACPTFGLAWPKGCLSWLSTLARYRILGLHAGRSQDIADLAAFSGRSRIISRSCLRDLLQKLRGADELESCSKKEAGQTAVDQDLQTQSLGTAGYQTIIIHPDLYSRQSFPNLDKKPLGQWRRITYNNRIQQR